MCEMNEFKRSWLKEYLSTHPKYQGQEITEALIDKWMDGVDKGNYVCNIHDLGVHNVVKNCIRKI